MPKKWNPPSYIFARLTLPNTRLGHLIYRKWKEFEKRKLDIWDKWLKSIGAD